MENTPRTTDTETNKKRPFKKFQAEYGDGANTTHHLGNDDYPEGANLPESEFPDERDLNGKVAGGNLDMLDEDSTNQ